MTQPLDSTAILVGYCQFDPQLASAVTNLTLDFDGLYKGDINTTGFALRFSSLKSLKISGSRASIFALELLQQITTLRHLDVSYLSLNNLPANQTQSLTQLETLDVSHNLLGQLDISHLTKLQELQASFNVLSSLPIFRQADLAAIAVSDNPLTNVSAATFASLTQLKELALDVESMHVEEVDAVLKQHATTLTALSIQRQLGFPQQLLEQPCHLQSLGMTYRYFEPYSQLIRAHCPSITSLSLAEFSESNMNSSALRPWADITSLALLFINVAEDDLRWFTSLHTLSIRSAGIITLANHSLASTPLQSLSIFVPDTMALSLGFLVPVASTLKNFWYGGGNDPQLPRTSFQTMTG
jgi:hypothetical protein